jgi:triphosphatase
MKRRPRGSGGVRRSGGPPPTLNMALPRLDGAMTVADAFARLVRASLDHWMVNQAAALAGEDEGVHQIRIAIRRLKTLFILFQPWIPPTDHAMMDDALTRLGRVLGSARDWDVFVDGTLADAARKPRSRAAARRIVTAARSHQALGHQAVGEAIRGRAYATFLRRLRGRLEQKRWLVDSEDGEAAAAIAQTAGALLSRQARKARRAGRHFAVLSGAKRHELRKKLKKLAYSLEFFAGLHDGRAVGVYLHRTAAVLDLLGEMNDLVVAEKLLVEAAGSKVKAKRIAQSLRRRWARRHDKLARRLPAAWRAFKKAKPFWEGRAPTRR